MTQLHFVFQKTDISGQDYLRHIYEYVTPTSAFCDSGGTTTQIIAQTAGQIDPGIAVLPSGTQALYTYSYQGTLYQKRVPPETNFSSAASGDEVTPLTFHSHTYAMYADTVDCGVGDGRLCPVEVANADNSRWGPAALAADCADPTYYCTGAGPAGGQKRTTCASYLTGNDVLCVWDQPYFCSQCTGGSLQPRSIYARHGTISSGNIQFLSSDTPFPIACPTHNVNGCPNSGVPDYAGSDLFNPFVIWVGNDLRVYFEVNPACPAPLTTPPCSSVGAIHSANGSDWSRMPDGGDYQDGYFQLLNHTRLPNDASTAW